MILSNPPEEFNKHMRQNLIDKGADVRRLPDIWQNTDDPEKKDKKNFSRKRYSSSD